MNYRNPHKNNELELEEVQFKDKYDAYKEHLPLYRVFAMPG